MDVVEACKNGHLECVKLLLKNNTPNTNPIYMKNINEY